MSFRDAFKWLGHVSATAYGFVTAGGPVRPASALPRPPFSVLDPAEGRQQSRDRPPGTVMALDAELRVLLHAVARLAEPRGCRLQVALQPGMTVLVDPDAFREAITEVLGHAVAQADRCVLLAGRRRAGQVQITVCDDGAAADAATQEALLRLPIQSLALQGGTVRIDPRPGQGTVITILLPHASGRESEPRSDRNAGADVVAMSPRPVTFAE